MQQTLVQQFHKKILLDLKVLINNNSLIEGDTPFSIPHILQ